MFPSAVISVLLVLVIIVAVCYVCFWLINESLPEPMRFIARIVVGIIGLVAIIQYVLPSLGVH